MKQSTIWFATAALCALGTVFVSFRGSGVTTAGGALAVALLFALFGFLARQQGN